ncbi:MAG: hypothetical protein LYZ66_02855 [Nitrososphaerales archaeon]|nr:hypothetical protein [Nitrososphaerales archaeon]
MYYADAVLVVRNGSRREWTYSAMRVCERTGKPLYAVNVDKMTSGHTVWKMIGMCGSPLLDDFSEHREFSKLVDEIERKFEAIKLKYDIARDD